MKVGLFFVRGHIRVYCDIQTGIFVNFVFLFTFFISTSCSVLSCFSFVVLAFVFCSLTPPSRCMGLLLNLIY